MNSKEMLELLEQENAMVKSSSPSSGAGLSDDERQVPEALRDLLDGRPEPTVTMESAKTGRERKKILRTSYMLACLFCEI